MNALQSYLNAHRRGSAQLLSCLGVVLAIGLTIGCGDSNVGHVQGKILKSDGSPLIGARVVARSLATQKACYGGTDAEGGFELTTEESGNQIPAGEYEVSVIEDTGPMGMGKPTVSPRYRSAATSGLKLSLAGGESKEVSWTLDAP